MESSTLEREATDPQTAAAGEKHCSRNNETAMWEEQRDKSGETI